MDIEKATGIIKALADGVDPLTGEVLPGTHLCQRGDLIRAFHVALGFLEREARRERRLKQARLTLPRNTGQAWSHDEDRLLLARYRSGSSIKDLAAVHARTERAIEARLERLGVLPVQTRASAPAHKAN